ncbi:MAG: aspartate/glutamate racemase family protein [Actinobacteria bacterium]|nr:aspartate/glutamate racemase family protein [Actinomycetota bacterium]
MKKIKILDLVPVIYTENLKNAINDRKELSKDLAERTNSLVQLDVAILEKGSSSLESMYDEFHSAPYILKKVKWAEKNQYDAIVIDCFFDPAVEAAREIVSIPVIGPCHSAVYLAAQVATKFSILGPTLDSNSKRIVMSNMKKYGVADRVVSLRGIDLAVLNLEAHPQRTLELLIKETKEAIIKDGAEAVVLGCTGLSTFARLLQEHLSKENLSVPVIEPLRAAVYNALYMVLYGISHSKLSFSNPIEKSRIVDW